jgi:hypothetical protein
MFSKLGFNDLQSDLKSEISNYMQQHEPPFEHQILRLIISLPHELYGLDNNSGVIDINKILFLNSNDSNKKRVIISLPCSKISKNIEDMIHQIMAKFNYKPLYNKYCEETNELQLNYSI